MSKKMQIGFLLAVVLAGAAAAYYFLLYKKGTNATTTTKGAQTPPIVIPPITTPTNTGVVGPVSTEAPVKNASTPVFDTFVGEEKVWVQKISTMSGLDAETVAKGVRADEKWSMHKITDILTWFSDPKNFEQLKNSALDYKA